MMQIEKNIPLPEKTSRSKYPFEEMEIGDSFFVGDETKVKTIRTLASTRAKRLSEKQQETVRFHVAVTEGGVRVWRTA